MLNLYRNENVILIQKSELLHLCDAAHVSTVTRHYEGTGLVLTSDAYIQ